MKSDNVIKNSFFSSFCILLFIFFFRLLKKFIISLLETLFFIWFGSFFDCSALPKKKERLVLALPIQEDGNHRLGFPTKKEWDAPFRTMSLGEALFQLPSPRGMVWVLVRNSSQAWAELSKDWLPIKISHCTLSIYLSLKTSPISIKKRKIQATTSPSDPDVNRRFLGESFFLCWLHLASLESKPFFSTLSSLKILIVTADRESLLFDRPSRKTDTFPKATPLPPTSDIPSSLQRSDSIDYSHSTWTILVTTDGIPSFLFSKAIGRYRFRTKRQSRVQAKEKDCHLKHTIDRVRKGQAEGALIKSSLSTLSLLGPS